MSCSPNSPNTTFNHTQPTRPPPLHLYPYNSTLPQHRTRRPPVISYRNYWHTKPTHRRPRPPAARRNPHPPHPGLNHYRNNQPIYSPPGIRRSTHGKPNCRPSINSTDCHCRICTPSNNADRSYFNINSAVPTNPARSSRSNNSSIRIRSSTKPLPTRKRLMAHQAHAYHMVDPSP